MPTPVSATTLVGENPTLLVLNREATAAAATVATITCGHRGEAAATATMAVAAATHENRCSPATAAMAVAATTGKDRSATAATTVTAAFTASGEGRSTSAAVTAAVRIASAATAAWLCYSRARDRQSSDARGENQPGHGKSPFGTEKRPVRSTVPSPERMEPAS